eukprot:3045139-Amphidinium_carterae.2
MTVGQMNPHMLARFAAWERQIEEHERISSECIADSVKGIDGKDGHPWGPKKGGKGKGNKNKWYNNGGKGGKGMSKDKGGNGKGQGKQQGGGNAKHFAGYCGKCGAWGHKQPVEEVAPLSATEETGWIYSVIVDDTREEETPSRVEETPGATDERTEGAEDESLISPIIVDDHQVEETPVTQ